MARAGVLPLCRDAHLRQGEEASPSATGAVGRRPGAAQNSLHAQGVHPYQEAPERGVRDGKYRRERSDAQPVGRRATTVPPPVRKPQPAQAVAAGPPRLERRRDVARSQPRLRPRRLFRDGRGRLAAGARIWAATTRVVSKLVVGRRKDGHDGPDRVHQLRTEPIATVGPRARRRGRCGSHLGVDAGGQDQPGARRPSVHGPVPRRTRPHGPRDLWVFGRRRPDRRHDDQGLARLEQRAWFDQAGGTEEPSRRCCRRRQRGHGSAHGPQVQQPHRHDPAHQRRVHIRCR